MSKLTMADASVAVNAPEFSESVSEGTVLQWRKAIGDAVQRDEILVEIETDKVVLEIPAPRDGVLAEILQAEGSKILSGALIGRIGEPQAGTVADPAAPQPMAEAVSAPSEEIPGRGERRVPMTRLRARIAERLLQSQASTASLVTFNEVNMQALVDLRQRVQADFQREHGFTLGYNAFFIKAAVHALQRHAILNASVSGEDIVYHDYFDVGVAVQSPRGLVVPILRNVDRLSIAEIEARLRDFETRARERKLTMEDLSGGTFSVSNGGVFGSMLSVPIINPPQSAILGVHATSSRPVAENGRVVIRPVNYLSLAYDHRSIDGRDAVLGLAAIKEALEDPVLWLMPEAGPAPQSDAAQATPDPIIVDASIGRHESERHAVERHHHAAPVATSAAAQPLPAPAGAAELQAELAMLLAAVLGVAPAAIDADAQFAELGLSSAATVEWMQQISQRWHLALMPTTVYAHPTLRQLAVYLAQRLARAPRPAAPRAAERMAQPVAAPEAISSSVSGNTSIASTPSTPCTTRTTSTAGAQSAAVRDRIAIIGMSGRYPDADTLDQFWVNLAAGRNSIVEIPATRWDANALYDPRPFTPGKISSKWLGLLQNVDQFDPLFFGISPADAEQMDPQQRLFLQEAYHAFEAAGHAPQSLAGQRCGIYLGLCTNDYGLLLRKRGNGIADRLGNSCSIASARIAYHLNLKGPALTVDTACSSSLVAIHLAVQALQNGETDLALAGGVTLFLDPELYLCWSASGMLAPDGQCKTFDNRANGFVPGEGVGAVVLKRLADAERDGDNILGVIAGCGINQDGRTNGITAPSLTRQAELIHEVHQRAGVAADSIGYVEAHGTGTKLGDPIELEALSQAFRHSSDAAGFCHVGSVKSNIGHTIAAAGMAGLHKLLLALRARQLPPSAHFQQPNEHFDFAASPFVVETALKPWAAVPGQARRAALSSFGISGTNAHLVIEEYPAPQPHSGDDDARLLWILSAGSAEQLRQQAAQLATHLAARPELSLADAAYTLQLGRDAMEHRLALVAGGRSELLAALSACAAGRPVAQLGLAQVEPRGRQVGVSLPAAKVQGADLDTLARQWLDGALIDWAALHRGQPRRRVALPGYPFAQERYWADEPAPAAPSVASQAVAPQAATQRLTLDSGFLSRLIDDVLNDRLDIDAAAHQVGA